MAAGVHNIEITRGTDYALSVTLKDNGGSALNVTNYTFKSEIRKKAGVAASATFTITKTNASGGVIQLALTDAQTRALPVGKLKYDLVANNGSGDYSQYIKGNVIVVDTVTDTSSGMS